MLYLIVGTYLDNLRTLNAILTIGFVGESLTAAEG